MLGKKRKLKPLEQWVCDHCQRVIRSPEHGWVEWLIDADGKVHGFRIVHNSGYSPLKPTGLCQIYAEQKRQGLLDEAFEQMYLTDFTDRGSMPHLLMFVDPGPYVDEPNSGLRVVSL